MTFANEDPVAIHSVIAAGYRIVRDICEKRGDIKSYANFTDWIAPGRESEFWQRVNATANFIKHANRDSDAIHELDDEESDFMIAFAAKWYRDLGNTPSLEMRVFIGWWMLQQPEAADNPELSVQMEKAGIAGQARSARAALKNIDRKGRLKAGQIFLASARNSN